MALQRFIIGMATAAAVWSVASGALARDLQPTVDVLNLRKGPGTSFPIVGILREGEKAAVVGQDQNWYRIRTSSGVEAWVAGWLARVDYSGELAFVRVSTDVLNVRSGPGTEHNVVSTVREAETYRLLEASGEWRRIRLPSGAAGWVNQIFVSDVTPPQLPADLKVAKAAAPARDQVLVRRGRSLRYDVLDTVKRQEVITYLDAAEGWVKVQTPRGIIGWVDGQQVAVYDRDVRFADAPLYRFAPERWSLEYTPVRQVSDREGLNLRTGPNTQSPVLVTLPAGTVLKVVAEQDGWLQIFTADGRWGWVAREYTTSVPGVPPSRLRRIEVTKPAAGVVRLTLEGDLAGAGTADWADRRAMTVLMENAVSRPAEIPLAHENLARLQASRAGIVLEFKDLPDVAVVERSPVRLVLEARPAVQKVQTTTQLDRLVIGLDIKGATQPSVWSEGGATFLDLPGARFTAPPVLPPGVQIVSQNDQSLRLRYASARSATVKRLPGRLEWVFYSTGLAGKTIMIDPGHGGTDPGAIASQGAPGLREKDANLAISLQLKKLLEAKGAKVLMTRATDASAVPPELSKGISGFDRDRLELAYRSEMANRARVDLFLSVHSNAGSKGLQGTEVYWSSGNLNRVQSKRLAGMLQSTLVQGLGRQDRGVKEEVFYVVSFTEAPAALAELAFLSDPTEARLLADPAFQAKAAQALLRGIERFYE